MWSHIQIIVHVDPLAIVSADANGVICRDIYPEEWENHIILTCPSLTEEQRHDICHFCFQQINKPYDYTGIGSFLVNADWNKEDRFFCSELAFEAYKQAGVELQKRVDHAFVSPEVLYISPLLERVDVERKNG